MPLNPLFLQVFYNTLIVPLQKVRNAINQGQYSEIRISMSVDVTPAFKKSQVLMEKFKILDCIENLGEKLNELDSSSLNKDKTSALALISRLESFAHVYNMLDVHTGFRQTKQEIGTNPCAMFGKTFKQVDDCNGNSRIINDNNNSNASKVVAIENSNPLINVFKQFSSADLTDIFLQLFSTLNKVEKDSSLATTLTSKHKNLFIAGMVVGLIELTNSYKENFTTLSNKLDSLPDFDEELLDEEKEDLDKVMKMLNK